MKPIECINEIPGWRLHFCRLRAEPGRHDGALRLAIGGTLATFHGRFTDRKLLEDRVVWCVRELLASAGIDPHRRPPASEILAQRILAGEEFSRRSAAEDLCGLLMLKTLVPWSVADYSRIQLPLRFRLGREGESCRVEQEEVAVTGWPVLADADRVLGSPLADAVLDPAGDPDEVLLTCFQPAEVAESVAAKVHLARFVVMTWAFRFVEERVVPAGR